MEYCILDARQEHLDQIERLEQLCFSMPWTRDQLASQLPDERHVFLVAAGENNVVLGYVGMMYVLDEGYISNVAVRPEMRGCGIASALIKRLLEISDKKELSFVTLEVRASNQPAIGLYQKHGFEVVGRRKNYYKLPREDALLMTRFWKRGTGNENTGV